MSFSELILNEVEGKDDGLIDVKQKVSSLKRITIITAANYCY